MSSSQLTRPNYRRDIDGLRAIAILSVVGYHVFPGKLKGGFIGVDIFFVISGFLISTIIFSSLEQSRFSIVEFYVRRARRIFPALIIVLIMSLLFGWVELFPDEYEMLGKHTAAGTAFIQNFILYLESGYFDTASDKKPLLHLWSLAVEEQFYLFWPLLLAVAWRRHLGLLGATALIGAASFAANLYLATHDADAGFYLPISRFWQLMTGGALAYAFIHAPTKITRFRNSQSVLGLVLITMAIFSIEKGNAFPGWWALLPTLGAFLLISAGPESVPNRVLLSNRAMVWIGLISYPLYLWHWPLLAFSKFVVVDFEGEYVRETKALLVALSFLLAWLTYRFIELPFRIRSHDIRPIYFICVVFVSVGLAGAIVAVNHGFPSRQDAGSLTTSKSYPTLPIENCSKLSVIEGDEWGLHCRFLEGGSEGTVVVFGDSHAQAGFPGLAEQMRESGFDSVQLASWGCPMLIGLSAAQLAGHHAQCQENTDRALSIIASIKSVRKVFILTRGPMYIVGRLYLPSGRDKIYNQGVGVESFSAALQKTIDYFSERAMDVYYITEVPELGFDPTNCLNRPLRIGFVKCGLEKADVGRWQESYFLALKNVSGAKIIKSIEIFCPSTSCLMSRENQLFYADSDHLSVDGSRWLGKAISRELVD